MNKKYTNSKTLLNKGTGFLKGYSHTLNPYTGCIFGCSYCYVRQLPVQTFRSDNWGEWLNVKENAVSLLEKELKREKAKGAVTIFMSSSTDPYQPIEFKEEITRSLLKVMVNNPPDFLFIQTRSSLVLRDMDLIKKLGDRVRVSITIETDSDEMRKHFSPHAPPIRGRLKALKVLKENNIATQAAIAPILPSSKDFPATLSKIVDRICIDDYFMGDGSGGKRTERLGIFQKYKEIGMEKWYEKETYLKLYKRFEKHFKPNQIYISQSGFMP